MAQPVYWIGQDGNIYYGSGQEGAPVMNLGQANGSNGGQFEARADGLYDRFTDNGVPALTYAATQIKDPALGGGSNTAPSGGGGGTATPRPVLDQAGVNNTQAAIDQIPGLLASALAAEEQNYNNAIAGFNSQEQSQRGTYDASSVTNQQNYDANFMDSIRAGIKGLGGLFALLRGTGAAGGTAEQLARDAVGGVTSNDIREGYDTRKANQDSLDSSLAAFLTDLKLKKQANEDTYKNNKTSIQRESDTNLQDLYGKMAGFYGDAEDTANYNNWMTKAGALTPAIAQNSKTQVSKYDTTPVSVKAPDISAFKGATQPSVEVGNNGQIGSGIFTITKSSDKKEKDKNLAPAGV